MTDTVPTPTPTLNLGRLRVRSIILATGCTLSSILIFGGGGYWLDLTLDKKPLFFIIGMVLAFVFTDVLIVLLAKKVHPKK